MDYSISYVLAAGATLLTLFWCFLYLRYRNSFDNLITAIDSSQYFLPELFFIGVGVIRLFKINLK